MRANDGRVDHHELVVSIGRQRLKNAGKHPALAPPSISPVRRLPFAVTLRQVTPGDAGAIPIDHRIHEQTVVGGRTADMAFPAGQEILDLLPLIVAQSIAVHGPASLEPTPHESEKK